VQAGRLQPEDIDEEAISRSVYTAGLPDPDLLIRTAGERRISNFLLWQISYAELHVAEVCWPDFGSPSCTQPFGTSAAVSAVSGPAGRFEHP